MSSYSPAKQVIIVALTVIGLVNSAAAHDESIDGDLSTDPNNPTSLSFALGSNPVIGTMQSPGDTRDYLTFTVGPGQALTSILLNDYEDVSTGGSGNRGFNAIIAGSSSFVPAGGNIGSFLGSNHLDPLPPGTDILGGIAAAPTGGSGFATPLGPGTYTYHVQQTGTPLTGYSLDFILVPEPAALLLGCCAAAVICLRRLR